jgi:tripartite-type tricarboxylate transporter receptor subunit TctC
MITNFEEELIVSVRKMGMLIMVGMLIMFSFSCNIGFASNNYPANTIQLICPWAAGGSTDLLCRTLAKIAPKYFPKPIVVINRTGGAAAVGLGEAKRARADGYTIVISSNPPFVSQPHLNKNLPYSLSDFTPVIGLSKEICCLAVNAKSPWNDINAFIEDAKKNNKVITFGHSGVGLFPHLSAESFFKAVGVRAKGVTFDGDGPVITAGIGGHIDVVTGTANGLIQQVKAGNLKVLLTLAQNRSISFPNVPCVKDMGYKDIDFNIWKFLLVPKGTPGTTAKYLHDNFKKILEDSEFIATMKKMDFEIYYLSGRDISKKLNNEYKLVGEMLKELSFIK